MEKESNNGLVIKSNYLVEAPCKLTITEQKIVYLILSMIDKNDEDFKDYKFRIVDFMEKLDLKGQSAYSQLKATTRLLRSRTFTIKYKDENGDSHELQTGWVSDADYNDNTGTVTFYLSKKLKPFLLQLKEYFTVLELDNLMQMKSVYSTKLYELLKQYKKIGQRTFDLKELKEKLAINKKSYELYNNFKRKVLLIAQEEINEKTDIYFEFEEIKEARKVVALKFYINSNEKDTSENKEQAIDEEYIDELAAAADETDKQIEQVRKITEGKLSEKSIKTLLKVAEGNIEIIKEKYMLAKGAEKINDLGKWMYAAIQNDYKEEKGLSHTKKSGFNNFKSRYDDDPEYAKKIKEGLMKKYNIKLD